MFNNRYTNHIHSDFSFSNFLTYLFKYYRTLAKIFTGSFDKVTRESERLFKSNLPKLSETQQKVLNDLHDSGIAVTSLKDLYGDDELLDTLVQFHEDNLDNYRSGSRKPWFKYLMGGNISTDPSSTQRDNPNLTNYEVDNPFFQLSLNKITLDIVNSYYKKWSRLVYQELNHTTGKQMSTATGSQRWHRDPGIKGYIKMFIYLNDVDETCGPFEYIPGTHYYGNDKSFPQKLLGKGGFYPADDLIEKHYDKSQIIKCVAPKGSVVFADVKGIHRGGVFTTGHRILSTCGFLQSNDFTKMQNVKFGRYYKINDKYEDDILTMSPESQFALNYCHPK